MDTWRTSFTSSTVAVLSATFTLSASINASSALFSSVNRLIGWPTVSTKVTTLLLFSWASSTASTLACSASICSWIVEPWNSAEWRSHNCWTSANGVPSRISPCSAFMISLASTWANWLAKSSRTAPRSSPVPKRFKKPLSCSTRSLSCTVSWTASAVVFSEFSLALVSTALAAVSTELGFTAAVGAVGAAGVAVVPVGGTLALSPSPDKFGISPVKVKPAFMKAPTISIIDTPFILAPFGIVMILPTEFNITLFVISVNPNSFIISITSGYSVTKSYTDLDKSNFFSILIPSCQKFSIIY